jgi:hypothetical protein
LFPCSNVLPVQKFLLTKKCVTLALTFFGLLKRNPLAEKTHGWSPYRYAFNNPVRFVDPKGLAEEEYHENSYGGRNYTGAVSYNMGGPTVSISIPTGTPTESTSQQPENTAQEGNGNNKVQEGVSEPTRTLPEVEVIQEEGKNPAGEILKAGLTAAVVISQLDSPVPGPADAIAVAAVGATLITAGIAWVGYEIYQFAKTKPGKAGEISGGHNTNISKAKKGKHDKGDTRRQQKNRDKKRQPDKDWKSYK